MTGKGYYITTVGDWKRRAGSFANSHWLLLSGDEAQLAGEDAPKAPVRRLALREERGLPIEGLDESIRILVLVEADEGTHAALEDDDSFEALPHPLSQKPISDTAQAALAGHGVASGASTFEAAEVAARLHPLLRHRVF